MKTVFGKMLFAMFIMWMCAAAFGQTVTTLATFEGPNGIGPNSPLIQGADGNFYGTTGNGGAYDRGTVFRMTPNGTITTLYSFCAQANCSDGWVPLAGLFLATDGNFYGTTYYGGRTRCEPNFQEGCGTVFRITPQGTLTTLYRFCAQAKCIDGGIPSGGLIEGSDGSLYGTTNVGGVFTECDAPYGGCGTVFKLNAKGLTTLHSFNRSDGGYPTGQLVLGQNGTLYGTTPYLGGTTCLYSQGTVFSITSDGAFTTLHSFCGPEGGQPNGLTVVGKSLCGAAVAGGANGYGTIFTMTPTGNVTALYSFDIADGLNPSTPVEGSDGSLYGTTANGGINSCPSSTCGTVFAISGGSSLLTMLYDFDGNDGAQPGVLLQGTNGIFYGTTGEGGDYECGVGNYGCGTAFSLNMGLGPFVAFVRGGGKVGQTPGILGQGFTGTSNVSFNGISANFTVVSDTFITATVPAGATIGYVTVTTPSGTLTSNVPFQVIP